MATSIGLGPDTDHGDRQLLAYLARVGAELAPLVEKLEMEGDEKCTRLARVLAPARNQIDAAVFLLVTEEVDGD